MTFFRIKAWRLRSSKTVAGFVDMIEFMAWAKRFKAQGNVQVAVCRADGTYEHVSEWMDIGAAQEWLCRRLGSSPPVAIVSGF